MTVQRSDRTAGPSGGPFSKEFLARYAFDRLLGEGAMGSVYLMRDVDLDRPVAVKVVKPEVVTADAQKRLQREARVLAKIDSPYIVAVHGAGRDGDTHYIVCELVEGETLEARLRRPPRLSLGLCLKIAMGILDGLAAAHAQGVVHRDLKPANVFLTTGNKPKIGDFGLAKAQNITSGTVPGQILGTPAYMSPEQCRGRSTTAACDLYAVGLILFEMIAGRRPFPGGALLEMLNQHANAAPPPLRALVPELPEELERLVARALEKDPGRRFPSAAEMRRALREVHRTMTPRPKDSTPGRPHAAGAGAAGADLAPGRKLAERYELERVLGQGGMGQVWLARDLALDGAAVAVKMLPPELWRDADAKSAVKHEAKLSQRLSHPNIVRLINLEPGDVPFLVMEFVDGPTLAELLASRRDEELGALPPAQAADLLDGLAAGVDLAHAHQVIHRDLKPANVLLAPAAGGRYVPKLADFGIAAELSSHRTRLTGVAPAGTLAYMSPEQLACERLTAASDVYALGATVYQMLTLAPPFSGGDMSWAIRNTAPQAPDGLAAPVWAVLERALAKSPQARPASAGEFAAAFRAAVSGRAAAAGIVVDTTPPTVRVDGLGATVAAGAVAPTAPGRAASARFPWLVPALVAVGIGFSALAAMAPRPDAEPVASSPSPSVAPSLDPSAAPSLAPSAAPSVAPAAAPSPSPSAAPSPSPSAAASPSPSAAASPSPSAAAPPSPSAAASPAPLAAPSPSPSAAPLAPPVPWESFPEGLEVSTRDGRVLGNTDRPAEIARADGPYDLQLRGFLEERAQGRDAIVRDALRLMLEHVPAVVPRETLVLAARAALEAWVNNAVRKPADPRHAAIEGLIKGMQDSYSRFYEPAERMRLKEDMLGTFGGVGMMLGHKDGRLVVISSFEGTPAARAGIHSGASVLAVDGVDVSRVPIEKAVQLLRGALGTAVRVEVAHREGGAPVEHRLVRAEIKPPAVRACMLAPQVGYARIPSLTEAAPANLKAAIDELRNAGAQGLILDLRDCPGGLLSSAVEIVRLFQRKGAIVTIAPKTGRDVTYSAAGVRYPDLRLWILVNKGTASGAEVIVAALQDAKRATVVGETTFGKGSVQTVMPLADGSAIALTTAFYRTPSGRKIHGIGIEPDVVVPAPKLDDAATFELRADAEQLFAKPEKVAEYPPISRHDPVLRRALELADQDR